MSVPKWMEPDPPPHPVVGGPWYPHIINHTIVGDGTVLVTWALPGLANAVIRVPLASWLNGEHQRTGEFLGTLVGPLSPDTREPPRKP